MSDIDPRPIFALFGLPDAIPSPVEGGHINQSWRVGSFLLQRINPRVFLNGEQVVASVAAVCDHLRVAAEKLGLEPVERRVLQVRRTPSGEPGVRATDGAWWRVLHFIEGTRVFQRAESPDMAGEAGRAFGLFQRLVSDYRGAPLIETIPGFHDTRRRLVALQEAVSRNPMGRSKAVEKEIDFTQARTGYADLVPDLMVSGELPTRVVHNDAKIANILFDARQIRAEAVIDLDTVMPGTLLSDMGDLIRSMASPTDEDEPDLSRIVVSTPVVESLVKGFVEGSGGMLAESERGLLIFSGILLAYEQGIRFLTDYLEGDRYYKIARPSQNLDRARAQFALVAELERCRSALEGRVAEIVRR